MQSSMIIFIDDQRYYWRKDDATLQAMIFKRLLLRGAMCLAGTECVVLKRAW